MATQRLSLARRLRERIQRLVHPEQFAIRDFVRRPKPLSADLEAKFKAILDTPSAGAEARSQERILDTYQTLVERSWMPSRPRDQTNKSLITHAAHVSYGLGQTRPYATRGAHFDALKDVAESIDDQIGQGRLNVLLGADWQQAAGQERPGVPFGRPSNPSFQLTQTLLLLKSALEGSTPSAVHLNDVAVGALAASRAVLGSETAQTGRTTMSEIYRQQLPLTDGSAPRLYAGLVEVAPGIDANRAIEAATHTDVNPPRGLEDVADSVWIAELATEATLLDYLAPRSRDTDFDPR